jgi:hypothetical protein
VPQLTVEGKYTVLGDTFADVLRIATELVEKERAGVKSASTE